MKPLRIISLLSLGLIVTAWLALQRDDKEAFLSQRESTPHAPKESVDPSTSLPPASTSVARVIASDQEANAPSISRAEQAHDVWMTALSFSREMESIRSLYPEGSTIWRLATGLREFYLREDSKLAHHLSPGQDPFKIGEDQLQKIPQPGIARPQMTPFMTSKINSLISSDQASGVECRQVYDALTEAGLDPMMDIDFFKDTLGYLQLQTAPRNQYQGLVEDIGDAAQVAEPNYREIIDFIQSVYTYRFDVLHHVDPDTVFEAVEDLHIEHLKPVNFWLEAP